MDIRIIVAMDLNGLIGKNNSLPWSLPQDLARFKRLTTGNTVVMGRKTYESIGKALPNRTNIILTRNKDYKLDDCIIANSIEEILDINIQGDLYVIGGAQIYEQFYKISNFIHLTSVQKNYNGDAYFPISMEAIENDFLVVDVNTVDSSYDIIYFDFERKIL